MSGREPERRPDTEPFEPGSEDLERLKKRKREKMRAAEPESPKRDRKEDSAESGPPAAADGPAGIERDGNEEGSEVESPPTSAEVRFRRQVALAELRNTLDRASYSEVREILERSGGHWHLERGRHLLHRLVCEIVTKAERKAEATPVRRVTVKLATRRESEPVAPQETAARAVAAVPGPVDAATAVERLIPVLRELPDDDEMVVTVDTLDQGTVEVAVTAEAIRVVPLDRGAPAEASGKPAPVELPRHIDVPETAAAPDPPAGSMPVDAPVSPATSETARRHAEADVAAVAAEPPAPEPRTPLGKAIRKIETAWWQTEVPPVAGGSPEADDRPTPGPDPDAEPARPPEETPPGEEAEPLRKRRPAEPETPPDDPLPEHPRTDPRRHQKKRPSPRSHRRPRPTLERGSEASQWRPDYEFKRRARKLIRRVAFRHGLKLTPEMETYLLQILTQPRLVGGRLVHGLTVNLDTLIRVMETLQMHYPLYARRRPS